MTTHLRIFAIVTILICGTALALPYLNRQLAIMQVRQSFPGLFPQGSKEANGTWELIQHEAVRTTIGYKVMLSIKNTSPSNVFLTSATIRCVAFDAQEQPKAIGTDYLNQIGPGRTEFSEVSILTEQSHRKINCSGKAGFEKR